VATEEDQSLQNNPVSLVEDFADPLQPSMAIQFRSLQTYSPSIYPRSAQQSHHNHQFTNPPEDDTFTEASTVSPSTARNNQPWLLDEEPYPPTWTDSDVAVICKTKLLQAFPHLGQDRLDSLFDPFYEKMKNENQYIVMSGMAGASVSGNLYTSGENSVLGYNYVGPDVGI